MRGRNAVMAGLVPAINPLLPETP